MYCTGRIVKMIWNGDYKESVDLIFFLDFFFIAFPLKHKGDWTYRIFAISNIQLISYDIFPFVKWKPYFTDVVNITGKLDAIKTPLNIQSSISICFTYNISWKEVFLAFLQERFLCAFIVFAELSFPMQCQLNSYTT